MRDDSPNAMRWLRLNLNLVISQFLPTTTNSTTYQQNADATLNQRFPLTPPLPINAAG